MSEQAATESTRSPVTAGAAVPPRRRRWRRPAACVGLLVATTVLLEVVLQIGAYVVWRMERQPVSEIPPGQNVVLCVGDSWTHGMGSSDPAKHSYPAVLQTLLRESTRRDWTVVNGGLSGQNSRDVLQRLPSQLAEFRPRVVCVLVGMNDYWSQPEPLTEAPTTVHGAYPFRWRIPRLVAWIRGRLGEGSQAVAAPASRGSEWAPRTVPSVSAYYKLPMKWRTTSAVEAHKQEGWQCNGANDVPGALAAFERAFAESPDDAQTRAMLVSLYDKSGRSEAAAPHLKWLADGWTRDHDYWTGASLVHALTASKRSQEGLDAAVEVLAAFPDDGPTWLDRAQCELHLGRCEDAKRSIDVSIRLSPDRWAYFWRYKIHYLGLRDLDEGLRTIYRAYVVFNDAKAAADDLRAVAMSTDGSRLRPVLESVACEPDVRARLSQLVDEALATQDGAAATKVLAEHLRRIVVAVQNAGATPVLMPYPGVSRATVVLRATAAELGVTFIDLDELFAERLAPQRWEDVRAPDGHCNDAGYRLMASIVADGLQGVVAAAYR
jgi:lysophospholipase L1-like esterase